MLPELRMDISSHLHTQNTFWECPHRFVLLQYGRRWETHCVLCIWQCTGHVLGKVSAVLTLNPAMTTPKHGVPFRVWTQMDICRAGLAMQPARCRCSSGTMIAARTISLCSYYKLDKPIRYLVQGRVVLVQLYS